MLTTSLPGSIRKSLGFEHYRQMIIEDLNKIIYQIDNEKKIVYVHVFCSTRQDFETILRRRLLNQK